MLFTVLKFICIVTYALGAASALGMLPDSLHFFGVVALVLLVAHIGELLLMFKHVRRYPGSLAMSVLLTLLYGLLHWKPLADQTSRAPGRAGLKELP